MQMRYDNMTRTASDNNVTGQPVPSGDKDAQQQVVTDSILKIYERIYIIKESKLNLEGSSGEAYVSVCS